MSVSSDSRSVLDSYTELSQVVVGFTVGLALGSVSPSLGWLIVYIIVYELLLWIFVGRYLTYWRGMVRITLNCATLLGILLGDWLITGETIFDAFLYDIPSEHRKSYIPSLLDPILDDINMWTRPQA